MTDRKIKKSINRELSPEISFTEFCDRQGIHIPAPTEQKEPKRSRTEHFALIAAAATVVVTMAIALPIVFDSEDGGDKVRYTVVSPEEVKKDGVFLFNQEYVQSCPDFYRYYSGGDDAIGYRVNDVVYGEEASDVYKFDYLVKLSDSFEFKEQEIELQFAFTKNGVRYEYTLNADYGDGTTVTQIKFGKGDDEYFVFLREHNGSGGFDIIGVQNFIELAFAPVTPGGNPLDEFFGS